MAHQFSLHSLRRLDLIMYEYLNIPQTVQFCNFVKLQSFLIHRSPSFFAVQDSTLIMVCKRNFELKMKLEFVQLQRMDKIKRILQKLACSLRGQNSLLTIEWAAKFPHGSMCTYSNKHRVWAHWLIVQASFSSAVSFLWVPICYRKLIWHMLISSQQKDQKQ